MRTETIRLLICCAALALLAFTGCALDPMERLSEQIDSQKVEEKKAAVLELSNLHDERAIEALVQVMESDENVYDMAGVALVRQGRLTVTPKKPDPVITMVAGVANNVHQPEGNRARAAWVLGEIGDREAIPALRAASAAKNAAAADAVAVQTQAKLALKKLGDSSDGAPFEIAMGTLMEPKVDTLPTVASVAPPEVEEKEATPEAPGAKGAAAKKPGEATKAGGAAGAKKPPAPVAGAAKKAAEKA